MSGPTAGVIFSPAGKPVPYVARPTSVVAGHQVAVIPGQAVVIGSSVFKDATPHWAQLSQPYRMGVTVVTEAEYKAVIGRAGNKNAPDASHPVTIVSHGDAIEYLKKKGGGLRLPTEAEWEAAARGPAVNVREVMEAEAGRFIPAELRDFLRDRFENFVAGDARGHVEVGGRIFTGEEPEFLELATRLPVYGWRVYSTPSGSLSRDAVWFNQEGTAPANWGPVNPYGLKGMTGNVWEWVADWYHPDTYLFQGTDLRGPVKGEYRGIRGGSWGNIDPQNLRAAVRYNFRPDSRIYNLGFRVVAPQDSEK